MAIFTTLIIAHLFFGDQVEATDQPNRFVNLVYPVRGRNLWVDANVGQVDSLLAKLKGYGFPATFLFQYDALKDRLLIPRFSGCKDCEFGIFLEVSEDLATDARVPYKLGDGPWYRADKIFLSGYTLLQRERLIDAAFQKFQEKFGGYPKTIGVWYIDPYSLGYIKDKYGVTGYVSVADQFDTDGHRDWGKPWGVPFYPTKTNILANAGAVENKLDVVELQWASRMPTEGFGNGVRFSQASNQANDYINNGYDADYFKKVLDVYLNNSNRFGQIIVGLEVGQELTVFSEEHDRQLAILSGLRAKMVTVSDFVDWYRREYPEISPVTKIADDKTTWINGQCYREGWRAEGVFDLRTYGDDLVSFDMTSPDRSKFLDREVPAEIDGIRDYRPVAIEQIQVACGEKNAKMAQLSREIFWNRFVEKIHDGLAVLKTSVLEGKRIIGLQTAPTVIFGWWAGRGVGTYTFPFQTLVRFKTL